MAEAAVWLLLLAVALVVLPSARDAFRLPKLLVAECLALASLVPLAWRLRAAGPISAAALLRSPGLRVAAPVLLVASVGYLFTRHPPVVAAALADLWIAGAVLVGWSAGLPEARLRRLLSGLLLPAALLAALAVLQFHGLFRPFQFLGGEEGARLGVTSLAGNPGDLGGLLALAALVGQAELRRRRGAGRVLAGVTLALCLYALAVSQTVTALAALLAGSLVMWGLEIPWRRRIAVAAAVAVAGAAIVLAAAPLRERVLQIGEQLQQGRVNAVLTGRLDGWRVAARMLAEHPLTGVGHGAFGAAYGETKLAMVEEGAKFYRFQHQVMFANAHNELLEAGAEWGIPGLAALAWALWVVAGRARRFGDRVAARPQAGPGSMAPADRSLAWAGLACLAVLSLAHFPFRLALTGYPALLWLAWVLGTGEAEGEETP